jgi:hypothetical protein|tara:strand:- start:275 stop:511 length:237 start_codon:yes stop_codon:yes gene_type:complete
MARNDPMRDGIWSETPGIGPDFEEMLFEDIENDDLFWLTDRNTDANHAHRKIDEYTALELRGQNIVSLGARQTIYQKT